MSITLNGVISPLAVPLTRAESLDIDALRGLIRFLNPHVDGYLLLGSSSEYAVLRSSVAAQVIDVALEEIVPGKRVLVGAGDTGTVRAVENVKRLAGSRVDAVAVTSGFYYASADQESLMSHFITVADASPLPVVLYNIPQNTAVNLDPATVHALSHHDNIVGIKDSSGDVIQFENYLFGPLADDFAVFTGREELTAIARYLGGAGVVSGLANIAPWQLRAVLDAVDAGRRDDALAAQLKVNATATIFAQGHWLSALKYAIAELGFGSGTAAQPLPRLSDEHRHAIAGLVAEYVAAPSVT